MRLILFSAAAVSTIGLVPSGALAQGGARISGAGISKVGRDTRKLTISAQAPVGSTTANGTIQFIHNTPSGLSRFRGSVSCLSVSGGRVQVSGMIEKGETASGTLLDGKAFAITINSASSPQSFSLPQVSDPAAIAACSGGRAETVPVTEDGFRVQ